MNIVFKDIHEDDDIEALSKLSSKIWNAYYPDIIGQSQVDYMLKKFHSPASIKKQIEEDDHVYIGAYSDDAMVGYLSYSKKYEEDLFLHKLYVDTELHSKGAGRALFSHAFENKNYKTIRLTVNRQNVKAINFYFKLGFTIEKIIDIDIGEGFVMNDFMMMYKNSA